MTYLQKAIAYLQLHWATTGVLLTTLWAYLSPTVHNYITNHPQLSLIYGAAAIVVAFYWKSPLASQQGTPLVMTPVGARPPAPPAPKGIFHR